jgi:hypothetical protein
MKASTHPSLHAAAASLLLASTSAHAENSTLQPISTEFASTQTGISIEAGISTFQGLELEEIDHFDGWTSDVELVVPLSFFSFAEHMQMRINYPFYTDGDARVTDPTLPDVGESIDIDGNAGVYNFMTFEFEHQLFGEEECGFNGAYSIGWGRTSELDTTTSDKDLYNHDGNVFLAGIKYDRTIFNEDTHWLVNLGLRYYYDTDDLHPDDKDKWGWADLSTAVIFKSWGEYITPVVELTYLGDFDSYNALALQPEVIIPVNENASVKLAGNVGLGGDGSEGGFIGSLSIGF